MDTTVFWRPARLKVHAGWTRRGPWDWTQSILCARRMEVSVRGYVDGAGERAEVSWADEG